MNRSSSIRRRFDSRVRRSTSRAGSASCETLESRYLLAVVGTDLIPVSVSMQHDPVTDPGNTSTHYTAGQFVQVTLEYGNQGDDPANANFDVDVYLSKDGTLDPNTDIFLGSVNSADAAGDFTVDAPLFDTDTFTVQLTSMLSGAYHLVLDVDPLDDVAEVDESNNILINTGAADMTFGANGPQADLNVDGLSDVLVRRTSDGLTGAFLTGGGYKLNSTLLTSDWDILGVGDFNGDGRAEPLVRLKATGLTGAFLTDGAWKGLSVLPSAQYEVPGVADFNGDGLSDVLIRRVSDGVTGVFLTDVSPNFKLLSTLPVADWQVLHTGDFDGDGKSDLLVRRISDGVTGAILTATTWVQLANLPVATWNVVDTGDFNADGLSDLLITRISDGVTGTLLTGGAWAQLGTFTGSLQVVAARHFDADAKADLLVRNTSTGDTFAYLTDSGGAKDLLGIFPTGTWDLV